MAYAFHQQPSTVSEDEQLKCSACKVIVLPNERNSHYRSDWHRYNVKRKCVGMPPIDRSLFESKLKSIIENGQKMDKVSNKKRKKALNQTIQRNYDTLVQNEQWQQYIDSKQNVSSLLTYRCILCSKTFKSPQHCLSHLQTKKHRLEFLNYHSQIRQQQRDEMTAFQATNDEQQNAEPATVDAIIPLNELKVITTIQNNPFIVIKNVIIKNKKRGHHQIANDEESKANKAEIEGGNEMLPRKAINPNFHCLFCSEQSFESMDVCLLHMIESHGFFVPIERRLICLESLLCFAGKIIGEYFQCVWCWKIFKSLKGVQSHMRHTGHCKLQIEYGSNITYNDVNEAVINESDQSPFVDYFDFDKNVIDDYDEDVEDDGNRELMRLTDRRHVIDVNENEELVMTDGTLIGHRSNLIVYKQKHHNLSKYKETQSEEQIIAQINNPNRKLKLIEMERRKNVDAFEASGAKEQTVGGKVKHEEAMNLQTRSHKVKYENWVNLQKSKGLR